MFWLRMEYVGGVVCGLERAEAGQFLRRVRADDAAGTLVAHRIDVDAAGERLERRRVAPGGRHLLLVLGGVGPARGGDELETPRPAG
jgi:hypothetical protein